jgi:hypothetical protein
MMDEKPWWQSTGLWSSIVGVAASLIGVASHGKVQILPDDQAHLVTLLALIATGVAGLGAAYGRIVATKTLTVK